MIKGAQRFLEALKRRRRALRRLTSIVRFVRKVTPLTSRRFPAALRLARRVCGKAGFEPQEAFTLGLLDLRQPDMYRRHVSDKQWVELQQAVLPPSWTFAVKDKSVFYRLCAAAGLPVPVLYATFFRGRAGWTGDGRILDGPDAWALFMLRELPEQFVVKPARGAFGRGFRAFRREADASFRNVADGRTLSAGELHGLLEADRKFDCFLFQQRLAGHGDLRRLRDTEALQTVRMLTLVDSSRQVRLLHGHFKLITGANLTDNLEAGRTGNIVAPVNLVGGTLMDAISLQPDRLGMLTLAEHPETGVPFAGFRLPLWDEARELVKRAAMAFLPVRLIGWDVALTPDGPVLVEGNLFWTIYLRDWCLRVYEEIRRECGLAGAEADKS